MSVPFVNIYGLTLHLNCPKCGRNIQLEDPWELLKSGASTDSFAETLERCFLGASFQHQKENECLSPSS